MSPPDAANALLDVFAVSGSFLLGLTIADHKPFYLGLGLGVPLAILYGGFDPNFELGGEAAAATAVGLLAYEQWLALVPLTCVLIGHSRGAWLGIIGAILFGLRTWLARWIVGGIAVVALLARIALGGTASIAQRWDIWRDTWAGVTWLGHGAGSLWTLFPVYATHHDVILSSVPMQAHNDFLQVLFEQGYVGGLLAFAAGISLLWGQARSPPGLVFLCILGISLVGFPFHMPLTLVVAAVAAGGLCGGASLRAPADDRRVSAVVGQPRLVAERIGGY